VSRFIISYLILDIKLRAKMNVILGRRKYRTS
jgi:hypothetical protein